VVVAVVRDDYPAIIIGISVCLSVVDRDQGLEFVRGTARKSVIFLRV